MHNLLFTSIIILATHLANAQTYTLYSDIQYDTISGVDPNLLSLDICKPNNITGQVPVVVYVHGGSWRQGDKTNLALMPDFYTNEGYVFVSVNYRLSPNPPDTTLTNAVRFPEHPRNVAKAISWVDQNIQSYGGDKNKIGLTGHSAGGHIAAVVATNSSFLNVHGLTLNNLPCICIHDAAAYNVPGIIDNNNAYAYNVKNAMGNDPSPWDDASPMFQAYSPNAHPWLMFSQQQPAFLYTEAQPMHDTLVARGYNVQWFPYALSHDELNFLVGVQDTADFNLIVNSLPGYTPSPNAAQIALAMTDTIANFFTSCFSQLTTGINDLNNNFEKLIIFPNPSNNLIFVTCNKSYQIYSMTGQLLKQTNQAANQINISDLPSGLYILKTENKVGRFIKTE